MTEKTVTSRNLLVAETTSGPDVLSMELGADAGFLVIASG